MADNDLNIWRNALEELTLQQPNALAALAQLPRYRTERDALRAELAAVKSELRDANKVDSLYAENARNDEVVAALSKQTAIYRRAILDHGLCPDLPEGEECPSRKNMREKGIVGGSPMCGEFCFPCWDRFVDSHTDGDLFHGGSVVIRLLEDAIVQDERIKSLKERCEALEGLVEALTRQADVAAQSARAKLTALGE